MRRWLFNLGAGVSLGGLVGAVVVALVILPGLRTQATRAAEATSGGNGGGAAAVSAKEGINVVVTDGAGHMPLEGAAVHVELDAAGYKGRRKADYKTDSAGRCRVALPEETPSFLSIQVEHAGRTALEYLFGGYMPGRDLRSEVRFDMEAPVPIGGLVQDEAGKPVANVKVTLRGIAQIGNDGSIFLRMPAASVITGPDGRWHFEGAPPAVMNSQGTLSAYFEHDDYVSDQPEHSAPRQVSQAALLRRAEVTVMKKGVSLSGRVIGDDGRTISGARVLHSVDPSRGYTTWTQTDEQGHFLFAHIEQVGGEVMADARGRVIQAKVIKANGAQPIELVLPAAYSLNAVVVDPTGRPVAGATARPVDWRLKGQGFKWVGYTDESGRFYWVDAPEEISLEVTAKGYLPGQIFTVRPVDRKSVTLTLKPVAAAGPPPATRTPATRPAVLVSPETKPAAMPRAVGPREFLDTAARAIKAVGEACKDDATLKPLASAEVKRGGGYVESGVETPEWWDDFPSKQPPYHVGGHGSIQIRATADAGGEPTMPFIPPAGCHVGLTVLLLEGSRCGVRVGSIAGDPDAHQGLVRLVQAEFGRLGMSLVIDMEHRETLESWPRPPGFAATRLVSPATQPTATR